MAMIVLVRYQIEIIDEVKVRTLYERSLNEGSDIVEYPELPGVKIRNVSGISKGYSPPDINRLMTEVVMATKGETPRAVILVRQESS